MLTFRFAGADGVMAVPETITAGMIGKEVRLEFSDEWKDLSKTAVFTAGGVTRDVAGVEDVAVIPAEVLTRMHKTLYVGVYGTDDEGTVVIPTIRVKGPEIQPGAFPSGDPSTNPDLPVWAQLQGEMDMLRRSGLRGLGVFYGDFELRENILTVLMKKISEIQTQDRGLQVGDLIITRNGVLLQVSKVDENTFDAKRMTTLVPNIDGSDYGVQDVADLLGYGSATLPVNLSKLSISDRTTLYFRKGTYYVSPLELQDLSHVTIWAEDAVLVVAGERFLAAQNCPGFRMAGGIVDGNTQAVCGVELMDAPNSRFEGVTFRNFGSAERQDVSMLNLIGDCTGFLLEQCTFDECHAGKPSSDGTIHAYGIFINRHRASGGYTASGVIRQCRISNVTGINGEASCDGIFIQAPPYLSNAGETIIPNAQILIEQCSFYNCEKRGVKSAVWGVTVEDCTFSGAFRYACVEFQDGHGRVNRSVLENSYPYQNNATCVLAAGDGGVEIRDCVFRGRYGSGGNVGYHAGFLMNKRYSTSIFGSDVHWDTVRVDNCYFDGCSCSIVAKQSGGTDAGYTLDGLEITNCRFGASDYNHTVELSNTLFRQILVYKFTDFRYDDGNDRITLGAANAAFLYPHTSNCIFVHAFDLHSRYWEDEPMSGYSNLPAATHTRILYEGGGMGVISYKEYTRGGSLIRGSQNPASITDARSKQLLLNSRVGDLFINTASGGVFVCTGAGTNSAVGTWTAISAK